MQRFFELPYVDSTLFYVIPLLPLIPKRTEGQSNHTGSYYSHGTSRNDKHESTTMFRTSHKPIDYDTILIGATVHTYNRYMNIIYVQIKFKELTDSVLLYMVTRHLIVSFGGVPSFIIIFFRLFLIYGHS